MKMNTIINIADSFRLSETAETRVNVLVSPIVLRVFTSAMNYPSINSVEGKYYVSNHVFIPNVFRTPQAQLLETEMQSWMG